MAYALTAFVAGCGWPHRRDSIAVGLFALAGLLEFMQLWVPGRSADVLTVFISGFGGLLGLALSWAVSTRLVMARSAAA